MHRYLVRLLLAGLLSAISFTSIAQDAEQQPEEESIVENTNDRPIEQIDVIGERTLFSIRYEIRREEDSLYRLFNDLNSADKFDIFCKTESRVGSYIRTRSCDPVFFTDFRRQSSRAALTEMRYAFSEDGLDLVILRNGLDMLESDRELRNQVEAEFEAMNEEIFRVAMENPDYFGLLQKIATLKAAYQTARKTRFDND